MLKHYVTYHTPGFFFAEDSSIEVNSRIPATLIGTLPNHTFAIEFYDQEVIESANILCEQDIEFKGGELGTRDICETCDRRYTCITEKRGHEIRGQKKNRSTKIFFGTKHTVPELKARNDETLRILISNLEGNKFLYGVHCITHNWQGAAKEDIIISSYTKLATLTEEM